MKARLQVSDLGKGVTFMSRVVFAGLCPHPPIVVPEVGKGSGAKINHLLGHEHAWPLKSGPNPPKSWCLASPQHLFPGWLGLGSQ